MATDVDQPADNQMTRQMEGDCGKTEEKGPKTMSRYTWECKTKEESDCEDDPNSQNKLEDPVKAPPKEDDSLNIHNSLTPKHENHKVLGEENSSEVNSLQNNMMMPKTKPKIPNGPRAKTVNGPSRAKDRVLRWEDDNYPPSPPCSVCSPSSTHSMPASTVNELQLPGPWTWNPYTP
ncbi:hypothetical protein INR49_001914 [Caranx melampygus]|nr:hypothetical protein INR49_001914 [Caranx melampygus]